MAVRAHELDPDGQARDREVGGVEECAFALEADLRLSRGAGTQHELLNAGGREVAIDTDYQICIYDGSDALLLSARAPKGETCRTNESRDCWKENAKGFRYVDRDLTPDGLQQVALKSGPTGKAQIVVKGRGNNLQAPPLSVMNLPVRVQLVNGGGACWEATYNSTFQNTAASFKAKSD